MGSQTSVMIEVPGMGNHDLYRVYTTEDESVLSLEDSATGGEIFHQAFEGESPWADLDAELAHWAQEAADRKAEKVA